MEVDFVSPVTISEVHLTQDVAGITVSTIVSPAKVTAYVKQATLTFSDGSTQVVEFNNAKNSKATFATKTTTSVRVTVNSFWGTTLNPGIWVFEMDFGGLGTGVSAGGTRVVGISGDTACLDNDSFGSCGGAGAPDKVYKLTLTQTRRVTMEAQGGSLDTILYAQPESGGTCATGAASEHSCSDGVAVGQKEVLDLQLAAGTHYLFVDAAGSTGGSFSGQVIISQLKNDGEPCAGSIECASLYCDNGYCCNGASGESCCSVATNCPDSHQGPANCNDPSTCQGTRVGKTCTDSICVAAPLWMTIVPAITRWFRTPAVVTPLSLVVAP